MAPTSSVIPVVSPGTANLQNENRRLIATNEELTCKLAELEARYAQLLRLDRMRMQLLSDASRDLRAPLALILGSLERLLLAARFAEPEQRVVETAYRKARELLAHVSDVLDRVQIEEGRTSARRVAVDFDAGAPESPCESARRTAGENATDPRPRILVVQNELEMRDLLRDALSREYVVEPAIDERDGLDRALRRCPDLILGDATAPAGEELVRALREHGALDEIPIVMLVAGSDDDAKTRLLRGGAQDCLARPFTVEELCARVTNLVTLKLAREDARRMMELRDEFLAIASHELMTPLAALQLQFQRMRRALRSEASDAPSPGKLGMALDLAACQTERLVAVVETLLDVSRLNAGPLALDRDATDLAELAEEAAGIMSAQLAGARCRLGLCLERGVVGLWDRARLGQVITNLLSNAAKHAPGSAVRLAVRGERGVAVLVVEDEGPGIEAAYQRRLFERFQRANAPLSASGLGLGLFVAAHVVEAHDGSIRVESAVGAGSRFIVELPMGATGCSHGAGGLASARARPR